MDKQRIDFTPEVIAQQREICDKATPGPWAVSVANEYPYDDIGSGLTGEHVALCGSKAENSKFIIDARTILPAALDALEASMQREAEKDAKIEEQDKRIKFLEDHILRITPDYKKSRDKLLDERDRLTAERDAAVNDLRTLAINDQDCATCKHGENNLNDCGMYDGPCEWEWRVVCASNTDNGGENK